MIIDKLIPRRNSSSFCCDFEERRPLRSKDTHYTVRVIWFDFGSYFFYLFVCLLPSFLNRARRVRDEEKVVKERNFSQLISPARPPLVHFCLNSRLNISHPLPSPLLSRVLLTTSSNYIFLIIFITLRIKIIFIIYFRLHT